MLTPPKQFLSGQRVKDLFDHEFYSLSSNLYNKTWIDSLSGSIDARIDALGGFNPADYITSTNAIARFADSSNIISKYAPSRAVRNGLAVVTDAYGEITHGLSPQVPNNWSVRPSGNINFGITTKVDATKLYVYLTAMGSRNVYWYASA